MESHKRSLLKSITWRVIAFSVTFLIVYLFIKKPLEAGGIAVITNLINIIAYYIHERIWIKINFGRK